MGVSGANRDCEAGSGSLTSAHVNHIPEVTKYACLNFNSPLSPQRAERLCADLAASEPSTVLDVGCGWGELLLRLLDAAPSSSGVGVDSDASGLQRARVNAADRGVSSRVSFVESEAAACSTPADVVICVGSGHAFGDLGAALRALRGLVNPGGRVLFGEAFWARTPTPGELAAMWDGASVEEMTDLAGLVDAATAAGFRPLGVSRADQNEWDDFESGFAADWEQWLLRHGHTPHADDVRAKADAHRQMWLRGYGDVMGFAYLTLAVPE